MRFSILLAVFALVASCGEKPAVTRLYPLDDGYRIDAILRGCHQGEYAACSCTMDRPISCVHDEKCPREETYAALRRWCRIDNYTAAFDTSDDKINMSQLAQEACEKYLIAALVVHRGYNQGRAKLASQVLCRHRLEWRAER